MLGVADRLTPMRYKPGDLVLAVAVAILAAVYTASAFTQPTHAASWGQAVLSWGFVAVCVVLTSKPKFSSIALIALNVAWSVMWLVAPINLGFSPWVLAVPVATFIAGRFTGKRFALVVLTAACGWALLSPFMWTWDDNFVLFYRHGADLGITLALHWSACAVGYLLGANLAAEEAEWRREANAKEQRLAAAREEERRAIARDIHDLLGHSLTLIKAQANAGLAAGQEREALQQINEAAGQSLSEIRLLVRGLRESDHAFSPAAGIPDLPSLVQRYRDAGLEVSLEAPAVDVSPVTSLATYRIVAEALANAARHQVDPAVMVRIAPGETVVVEVVSTGQIRPQPGTGVGLEGLRERAASAGGTLKTWQSGETFTVRAELAA